MGVAVNDRRRNQQTGAGEDHANFIDYTMFGKRAETLSRILRKGQLVCLDGRLRSHSWERDGVRRSKVEVVVGDVELMARPKGQAPDAATDEAPYVGDEGAAYGDEIPF